jgi:hypothetical protein
MFSGTIIKASNYKKYLEQQMNMYNDILEQMYKKPFKPYVFPWGMMAYECEIPIYNINYMKVLLKLF